MGGLVRPAASGAPHTPSAAAGLQPLAALGRAASAARLPPGAEPVLGDALDAASYASRIAPGSTFVHLVGVAHPSPAKARLFRSVDLASALAAVKAAREARVEHFVYVSVAQPAPVMKAYQRARAEAEAAIRASGLDATILRPWYVLGPGHRWPMVLLPLYLVAERLPWTRAGALRLGFIDIEQMLAALAFAVEHPAAGVRILGVPEIRASGR